MNKDILEGNWKKFSGKVREKWAKLTDSDMDSIGGKKDRLVGRLQEIYGHKKEEVEKDVDGFLKSLGA